MFQRFLTFLILAFLFLTSCDNFKNSEKEKPIARVYDLYLYPSDLKRRIPEGISTEDSIRVIRRVIDSWVKEKLLLKRAEQYLSGEQKDVEKQVEEYRSSLLTFKYKQKLLSQNLDTVISEQDLKSYYDSNSSNYILVDDVVKVSYIKLPFDAPRLNDVKRWYKSDLPEDLDNLEKYCVQHASNYLINGDKWFTFINLISSTPLQTNDPIKYLNANKYIEVADSSFYYFIHIIDRVKEGEISPLDLVRDDIRSVILNKRKITFIEDLENSIYNDGREKSNIEIY